MKTFRSHFPILQSDTLFLNHCVVSVIPEVAGMAVHEFMMRCARNGICIPEKDRILNTCRARAAVLLNAQADEIAFAGNTAQGINLVANGISWHPGDEVVTCDIEYPDNFHPWKYLERKGVKAVVIPTKNGRVTADDVKKVLSNKTRLVSLSYVQYTNGFRLDAQKIGELCREKKVLFMLDSIQGVGAMNLDVKKVPVDFIAAGGHKWLIGPLGSGIFYCRREVIDHIDVSSIGQGSMMPHHHPLSSKQEFHQGATRFEGGPAKNAPSLIGLNASLGLILQAGIESIEKKILSLTAHTIESLLRLGYVVHSPHTTDAERSGIVAFSSPEIPTDSLLHTLSERKIIVSSPNGDWIRVAPHFYNSMEDLDRFFDALPHHRTVVSSNKKKCLPHSEAPMLI